MHSPLSEQETKKPSNKLTNFGGVTYSHNQGVLHNHYDDYVGLLGHNAMLVDVTASTVLLRAIQKLRVKFKVRGVLQFNTECHGGGGRGL